MRQTSQERYFRAVLSAALPALLLVTGCGTPGAPQPPSLHLPGVVQDLHATRKGDVVTLTWTVPANSTDEQAIGSHLGSTRVCRNQVSGKCADVLAEVPAGKVSAGKPAQQQDSITAARTANPGRDFVNYSVETLNDRGRSAGFSNQAAVPLVPGIPAVQSLTAELKPDGIVLRWIVPELPAESATRNTFQIIRTQTAPEMAASTVLAEVAARSGPGEYVDRAFTWEKTYSYRVVGVTQLLAPDGHVVSQFEGDEPAPASLTAHDVFPPAAPVGLQAVYSSTVPGYIDLTWTPNEETDLAGYNIYRASAAGAGATFTRINTTLVKTPAFRDTNVAPGQYSYRVTAVDARGNESAQSGAATETVPQQ